MTFGLGLLFAENFLLHVKDKSGATERKFPLQFYLSQHKNISRGVELFRKMKKNCAVQVRKFSECLSASTLTCLQK